MAVSTKKKAPKKEKLSDAEIYVNAVNERRKANIDHIYDRAEGIWKQEKKPLEELSKEEIIKFQFEPMSNHPLVEEIKLDKNRIHIHTGKINLTVPEVKNHRGEVRHKGGTSYLGNFEITFPIDVTKTHSRYDFIYGIEILNVTNEMVDDPDPDYDDSYTYGHPHLDGETPCLGNLTDPINFALIHGEFYAAFIMLLQWLQTCNPDDCGVRVATLWLENS